MNSIKLLDDKTINKIAAGEVVERPSSVIKELIENSIDAKSTSITIEIAEGGKSLIRVTDNGIGIDKKDLDLAFLRHSTSKISKAEDLSCINTLGFRGEALASIASISQVELISKTNKDMSGVKTIVNGGVIRSKTEIGCPRGTTIIVRNLFFNTPVRKKFLKSDNTESTYISDIVYKLALSNPHISFTYIKDNKQVIRTPGRGDLSSTVYSVLGKEFVESTFQIDDTDKDMHLTGFIGKPNYTRANRASQFIFINGRYIKDIELSKTIESSYQTLITTKRYPVFLLFLKIDLQKVDINVHPTKTEIRFTDRTIVDDFIYNSVKRILGSENLIPNIKLSSPYKPLNQDQVIPVIDEDQVSLEFIDKSNIKPIEKELTFTTDIDEQMLRVLDFSKQESKKNIHKPIINEVVVKEKEETKLYTESELEKISRIPDIKVIGHLFKTYILGQDSAYEKFYMIDQHAAHERIMYEKIKKQLLEQKVSTQILLNTEILEFSLKDIELIKNNLNIFLQLGFDIEEFGNNTLALRGVPLVFGEPDCKKLFIDILGNLDNKVYNNYELQLDKIMKLACTSAIKANDGIEQIEIDKLIEDLKKTQDPFTCPHGRPIIIEMSKYEIERKFKRV